MPLLRPNTEEFASPLRSRRNPPERCLPPAHIGSMSAPMNPPQKQFSLIGAAFGRQMPVGSILVVFTLLFCRSTMAFDAKAPARIQVIVLDEQGKPVSKAIVRLRANGTDEAERESVRQSTTEKGQTELKTFPPHEQASDSPDWGVALHVDCDGYLPHRETLYLFPAAQLEKQITLSRARTTLIRLRGPTGKPLPLVPLSLSYARLGYHHLEQVRADERGEFSFVHGELRGGFEISIGGLHRTGLEGAEVTLTLNEEELESLLPPHRVEGRVVTADGHAAVGWFIAHGVASQGSSGALPGGPWQIHYGARKLTKLGADGSFSFDQNDEVLVVVSPQGVPFLYPLNGRSWQEETRHLTVRVPPVRRVHSGQLLYPDGRPAAQKKLSARSVQSIGNLWTFGVFDPSGESYWPISPAKAEDGTTIGSLATDGQGRYELPVYFGAQIEYRVSLRNNYWHDDLTAGATNSLRKHGSNDLTPQKRVTLVFTDEQGVRVPKLAVTAYSTYTTNRQLMSTSGGLHRVDTLGCHLFVPANVDRIDFFAASFNWNQFTQSVRVVSLGDQIVEIPVAERLRRKPLTGIVLDPDGQPVAGVSVAPYQKRDGFGVSGLSGVSGHEKYFLGLNVKTDALGRFHFDAAPDECELSMYRFSEGGNTRSLPGWIHPPVVTRDQRDLTIRLQRSGSVRVRLPGGTGKLPEHLSLDRLEDATDQIGYLVCDEPKSKTLFAPFVQPGQYRLTNYDPKRLNTFTNSPIFVRAGEETVVDLTAAKHLLPAPSTRLWTEFVVEQDGKPVSGAIVNFLAVSSDSPWEQPQSDLADNRGRVRFLAKAGERFTAVARVPGQLVGWKSFTPSKSRDLKISMTRTKTLVVRLKSATTAPASGRTDSPQAWIQLTDVAPHVAKAIFRTLGLEPRSHPGAQGSESWGQLVVDAQLTRIAEDLPVGTTCKVSIRDGLKILREKQVTVAADKQAVSEISLE